MAHPLAGQPAPAASLTDISALLAAYREPATQPVAFGTSGHRGTALNGSFNAAHILAIAQAVAEYRAQAGIAGPLFLGMDTHALSAPAQQNVIEVLAANGITVHLQKDGGYTPTPVKIGRAHV
jgi:phosphoglucomutase